MAGIAVFFGMDVVSALDNMVAVQIIVAFIIIALAREAAPQAHKTYFMAALNSYFIPVGVLGSLLIGYGFKACLFHFFSPSIIGNI